MRSARGVGKFTTPAISHAQTELSLRIRYISKIHSNLLDYFSDMYTTLDINGRLTSPDHSGARIRYSGGVSIRSMK